MYPCCPFLTRHPAHRRSGNCAPTMDGSSRRSIPRNRETILWRLLLPSVCAGEGWCCCSIVAKTAWVRAALAYTNVRQAIQTRNRGKGRVSGRNTIRKTQPSSVEAKKTRPRRLSRVDTAPARGCSAGATGKQTPCINLKRLATLSTSTSSLCCRGRRHGGKSQPLHKCRSPHLANGRAFCTRSCCVLLNKNNRRSGIHESGRRRVETECGARGAGSRRRGGQAAASCCAASGARHPPLSSSAAVTCMVLPDNISGGVDWCDESVRSVCACARRGLQLTFGWRTPLESVGQGAGCAPLSHATSE